MQLEKSYLLVNNK